MAERKKATRARTSSRNKRDEIMQVATEQFGREGFEYSKWADVAAAVGVGSTALYHYFESKLHASTRSWPRRWKPSGAQFGRITEGARRLGEASSPSCAPATTSPNRRSSATGCSSRSSSSSASTARPRARRRRASGRAATRDLEFDWSNFLSRGMAQGVIPEADPRMLTAAVLGLHNSVWHWYRPGGTMTLDEVGDFYVRAASVCWACRCSGPNGAAPAAARSAPGAHERADEVRSGRDRLAVAPRLAARDRHVMDLVGSVRDLEDARDGVELGRARSPARRRRRRGPGSRGRSPTSRPRAPRP